MTPGWDALVAECHEHRLKIGPLTERPDGKWRAYLQRGSDIFRNAEGDSIEAALAAALDAVKRDDLAPAKSFLD